MANGSIRVHSKTEYHICVNDAGDEIVFDISDTGLANKMVRTFDKVNNLVDEYQEKAKVIDERPDEPFKTTVIDGKEKVLITKNQYDGAAMIDELYQKSRETLDTFLGVDACQKIFGDKNYYNMFDDLAEQLKPHFEKMGINSKNLKAKVVNKYTPNRESKRALK